jgi:synaptojanin
VGETIWITFFDGQSALKAAKQQTMMISNFNFNIQLKTNSWCEKVEEEIALCTTSTFDSDVDTSIENSALNEEITRPTRPPLPKLSGKNREFSKVKNI